MPDLLVISLARNVGFLNTLSDMMIERRRTMPGCKARLKDGEIVSLGGKYPVKIIDANATAQAEYSIQAGLFYGYDDYAVLQVLAPDQQSYFPDDVRCDPRYRVPIMRKTTR